MTQSDKGQILMQCGAINDLVEQLKWHPLANQLKTIQLKIETIVNKTLPENVIETKDY